MPTQYLKPSPRYLAKQILIFSLITALIMIFGAVLGWLISLDRGPGGIIALVFFLAGGAFWLIAVILSGPFYRSLKYEIQDDEVIVHVGIWTKSVKHVPYRTVTNIKINRGILDRFIFNLGTLNVQTAGMSGSTGAEESLVGLPNVHEIYELVATKLRKFRGAMTPTAAEVEGEAVAGSAGTLERILDEVGAIRKSLEK